MPGTGAGRRVDDPAEVKRAVLAEPVPVDRVAAEVDDQHAVLDGTDHVRVRLFLAGMLAVPGMLDQIGARPDAAVIVQPVNADAAAAVVGSDQEPARAVDAEVSGFRAAGLAAA